MEIFLTCVSVVAILLFLISVQFEKKSDILLVQIASSVCYGIVYFFKSAWSGFITEIIEQTKSTIFYFYEKKGKKIPVAFLVIFVVSLFVIAYFTYDGINTLVPLIINLAYFISTYIKNPKAIRVVMLICAFLWAYYNFSIGAYVLIIGNSFEVVSATIALLRFKKKKKD